MNKYKKENIEDIDFREFLRKLRNEIEEKIIELF